MKMRYWQTLRPYCTRAYLLRAFWPPARRSARWIGSSYFTRALSTRSSKLRPQPTDTFSWHLTVREDGCLWGPHSLVTDSSLCPEEKSTATEEQTKKCVMQRVALTQAVAVGRVGVVGEQRSEKRNNCPNPPCLAARRQLRVKQQAAGDSTLRSHNITLSREQPTAVPETDNFVP